MKGRWGIAWGVWAAAGCGPSEPPHVPAPIAPEVAVEVVPDGAWTFYNDERGIVHRGAYYLGYVRSDGHVGVTRWAGDGTAPPEHTAFTSDASREVDDHNNPAFVVRPDGRLLALHALHNGPGFFYRIAETEEPRGVEDWSAEEFVAAREPVTYSNLAWTKSTNELWALHRETNFNPTLVISRDGGRTWSGALHLIATGAGKQRPYFHLASDGEKRWDLVYSDGHPRNAKNSLYHVYMEDSVLHCSDGQPLAGLADLPLAHDRGQRGTEVYRYVEEGEAVSDEGVAGGRAAVWDLAYDSAGHPVCVFQVQAHPVDHNGGKSGQWPDGRIQAYWARWTGAAWETHLIAQAGRGQYAKEEDFGGGICLDPEDPRRVYIASNARDPFDLAGGEVPLSASERYEIYRGFTADSGATFQWEAVTHGSDVDHFRPFVPAGRLSERDVFWVAGTYRSYTRFDCGIWGVIGAEGREASGGRR